ncbi:hypothetical protein FRC12_002951 [Ceratobasidium sp. 428]|nr:hypothetical protein FRC12_002951 [Ceratobasidium sp. 428]
MPPKRNNRKTCASATESSVSAPKTRSKSTRSKAKSMGSKSVSVAQSTAKEPIVIDSRDSPYPLGPHLKIPRIRTNLHTLLKPRPRSRDWSKSRDQSEDGGQSEDDNQSENSTDSLLNSSISTACSDKDEPLDINKPTAEPAPPVAEPTPPVAEPAPPAAKPVSPAAEPTSPVAEPTLPAAEPALPPIPKKTKCRMLRATIEQDQQIAEARAANGDSLVPWLTPAGYTGDELIDRTMNGLRDSKGGVLWLGDPHKIGQSCEWVSTGPRSKTSTLHWNKDSPNKPEGWESEAVFGFLGMVLADGMVVMPEAFWRKEYGENKINKLKRSLYTVDPGPTSKVPHTWFFRQIKGSSMLVENARRLPNGTIGGLSYCFVNRVAGSLRVRAPVFEPLAPPEAYHDAGCLPPEPEADIPPSHRYATWDFSTEAIHEVFDRVVATKTFEPQPLNAYNRYDKLIHPNDVVTTLPGAIVLVHCTLERSVFGKKDWQFYANLIKLQVLKLSTPVKLMSALKRKFAHGYGPSGSSGSSTKGRKAIWVPAVVNEHFRSTNTKNM